MDQIGAFWTRWTTIAGVKPAQERINTGVRQASVLEAWDGRNGARRADNPLNAKQHAAADSLRSLLGDRLDLKVLE